MVPEVKSQMWWTSLKVKPIKQKPLVAMKPIWWCQRRHTHTLTDKSAIGVSPVPPKKSAGDMKEHEDRERILDRNAVALLCVEVPFGEAQQAASFYKAAFGAKEFHNHHMPRIYPDVSIELNFLGVQINICERHNLVKTTKFKGGQSLRTMDVDATIARLVRAGAVAVSEVVERLHAREGKIVDPYGLLWIIRSPANNPPPTVVLGQFMQRLLDPRRCYFR